jgi:hypothetical protein
MTLSNVSLAALCAWCASTLGYAQLIDLTRAPNAANAGIAKSLDQEIGAGRGDILNAGLIRLYHQPRSISRGPARPPDISAQVSKA